MKIAPEIEWHGGIDGYLVLGETKRETRSGREFVEYLCSCQAAFDIAELERIGSCAYFAAVCEVRSTTAGFVLAAADQVIDPTVPISSDEERNAAFGTGVETVRAFLMRIRGEPGGTLADAAFGYVKLLKAP